MTPNPTTTSDADPGGHSRAGVLFRELTQGLPISDVAMLDDGETLRVQYPMAVPQIPHTMHPDLPGGDELLATALTVMEELPDPPETIRFVGTATPNTTEWRVERDWAEQHDREDADLSKLLETVLADATTRPDPGTTFDTEDRP